MDSYWTAPQEAAASDIFRNSDPLAPELIPVREDIAKRNGFLYTGKMDADGFSSTGYSYAEEDYFQRCKATKQPYISDIINDGQQMIFLLEVPIITEGRFEGVVYGGINAAFLSDIVANLSMGDDGVAYVLDGSGNVIGHRDESVVAEGSNMIEAAKTDSGAADVAEVNQRMLQGETGFGSYNFYGDNKLVGFAPIEGFQKWSIAIETSQREFKSTLDRSIFLTILVVFLVVIATYPAAVIVGRSISRPIQACVVRLKKLADGDLHTATPVVKSKDETAELTKALKDTIFRPNDVVQDVSNHLEQMGQGDFREDISRSYWGDFIAIEKSIKAIHSSLKDTLYQISQSAETVAVSAVQVSNGAKSLSQGATEQANAVHELSATVSGIEKNAKQTVVSEEVRSLASKSDAAAKATKELIENSIAAVKEGSQVVEKVTGALNKTSSIAGNVTAKMGTVVESVESQTVAISEVTTGISQISSVVQNTSMTSQESAATSQRLTDQSSLMNNLVRRFKLK